ncbi:MAG: hypothetical protein ACPGDB_04465 [Fusobacterium sp.]
MNKFNIIIVCVVFVIDGYSQTKTKMKEIIGGTFVPLYGSDDNGVKVNSFLLDVYPVTNAHFLTFIKEYSKWKKSKILRLFADNNYLNKSKFQKFVIYLKK